MRKQAQLFKIQVPMGPIMPATVTTCLHHSSGRRSRPEEAGKGWKCEGIRPIPEPTPSPRLSQPRVAGSGGSPASANLSLSCCSGRQFPGRHDGLSSRTHGWGGRYLQGWLLRAGSADDSLLSFQKCMCLYSGPCGLPAVLHV